GHTVSFVNTVIIMTSNVGSRAMQEHANDDARMRQEVTEELKHSFRPEFLNRIDDIVFFKSLSREDLKKIVDVQLRTLEQKIKERKFSLKLSDEAKDLLCLEGYDQVYGARPLKRLIQQRIMNPLAEKLLAGEVKEGDTVKIEVQGSEFSFKVSPK